MSINFKYVYIDIYIWDHKNISLILITTTLEVETLITSKEDFCI